MARHSGIKKSEKLLTELQGNILKVHGRNYMCLIMLRFIQDIPKIENWIKTKLKPLITITSAKVQINDSEKDPRPPKDPGLTMFLLSSTAYTGLGRRSPDSTSDIAFNTGMQQGRQ